jgi:ATP-dependent Clp protease ATP-binding subunit ClpA/CheY-like chemotaxis protein
LASKIVGQPTALETIVPSIHLHASGLAPEGRPVGVFLLLGPTGTGKTRTVEAIAEVIHGRASAILRIDCGEFQSDHEIAKLIGAPPGYVGHVDSKPRLSNEALDEVRSADCDLALVLFDEIEKAAPAMYPLLLSILDRGALRLGSGHEVDFTETLIFLTSNLGARDMMDEISPTVGFATGKTRSIAELRTTLEGIGLRAVRKHFSPEFLNRIDAVATYRPLDTASIVAILDQHIHDLQHHVHTRLGARSFEIEVAPAARYFMIEKGTSLEHGARELRRVIHRHLTQPLAIKVAAGEIGPGATVSVDLTEDGSGLHLQVRPSSQASTDEVGTVLVVDESEELLAWMQRVLEGRGCRVLAASSAQQAHVEAAGQRPDLALIDHMVADGDGVALARELQDRYPDIRIVITSDVELDEEDELVCDAHDFVVLVKPFLSEELITTLEAHGVRPLRARSRGA